MILCMFVLLSNNIFHIKCSLTYKMLVSGKTWMICVKGVANEEMILGYHLSILSSTKK